MLALVIDTSSAAVTAGVADIGGVDNGGVAELQPGSVTPPVTVLAERVTVDARAHGELLSPSVKACLAEAGLRLTDLDAIIAGVGPGPFTGLRVGLVTAAAMADALGLPSYAVCSLDAIGAARPDVGSLLVAGDARRKEVYWARYRSGAREGEPAVAKPADLPAGALTCSAMAGAGARLYESVLGLPLIDADYPTVAGLAGIAAERLPAGVGTAPSQPLTPLYLRRPDAVAPAGRKQVSQPTTGPTGQRAGS